jgi:hypothetical protein
MKSELRLQPHTVMPGKYVAEIWYDGKLIGTVTGADGPGVRIISKHFCEPIAHSLAGPADALSVIEVRVNIQ